MDGVQQYRWSKWNATTSYYSYYTLSFRNTGSVYNPDGFTGNSSYSFNSYTGKFSPSGSTVHITNSGTVYSYSGGATATGGGYFSVFSADVSGPYYGSTTSKGSTFLGYVYGASGAYPNGGTKTVDGTTMDSTIGPKQRIQMEVCTCNRESTIKATRLCVGYGLASLVEQNISLELQRSLNLSIDEQGVWSKLTLVLWIPTTLFICTDDISTGYTLSTVRNKVWDGEQQSITGYRPLERCVPLTEPSTGMNKSTCSTDKACVVLSNGTAKDFILPEQNLTTWPSENGCDR